MGSGDDMAPGRSPGPTSKVLVRAWFAALPVLVLGPALWRSGYVLSYDMVWVPDLTLRPQLWGLGTAWPRAVPSDAVVAVLDSLVGGMVLQKVLLYGMLAAAAFGVRRLLPGSTVGQLVAGTAYVWNPFVAERLVIGHWPVLLAHAALPWLVGELARQRRSRGLFWWLVVGSLSASAGIVSGGVALAHGLGRWGRRGDLILLAGVLGANAPWLVTGLLHAGNSTDPSGVRAFAAHGEGPLPAPLATLALGGIWNDSVVPGSRAGVLAWIALVVLLLVAVVGLRPWWKLTPGRTRAAMLGAAVTAWVVCLLGWALPETTGRVVEILPVTALLRDGARYLSPLALLAAVLLGHGAAALVRRSGDAAMVSAAALVALPVLLMPDLAWGGSGNLRAVDYPASYDAARQVLLRATHDRGETVVLLPFSSYRTPTWNHHHPVLDPAGRYLPQDFVASDELFVSGRPVAGEDPLARRAGAALRLETADDRAAALARLGVRYVVSERHAGTSPEVTGQVLYKGTDLEVQTLSGARPGLSGSGVPVLPVLASWLAWSAVLVLGVGTGAVEVLRDVVRRRRRLAEVAPEGW